MTDTIQLNNQQQNHAKLMAKMAAVIENTDAVQKKGRNTSQNYNYATHADIIAEIRKEITKQKLFILPKPDEYTQETPQGAYGTMTSMKIDFEIVDTETGYSVTVHWFGQGMDKGDKGIYKAYTGTLKYFLLDTFMIPTDDDPEKESPEVQKAKVPYKPVVVPPITEEQKKQILDLLPKKGKTVDDLNAYVQSAYKKGSYTELTTVQAEGLVRKITAMPDDVDIDAVDEGIEKMKAGGGETK